MDQSSELIKSQTHRHFEKIQTRWSAIDSMAGVGIDPDADKIPQEIWDQVGGRDNLAAGFLLFSQTIIDATAPYTADYKVNANFFPGKQGREALTGVFKYLKERYPQVLRVCDGKFADVGHTAEKLAEEIFDQLDADAVLLNPYLGLDALKPFISRPDKTVILCINTSNPSAGEVQNLLLDSGKLLWQHLLEKAITEWNSFGNIIPVLSATHPERLTNTRKIIGETPVLLAGVGTQGGSLEASVPPLLDSRGYGLLISSSRKIIYAKRQEGESIGAAAEREIIMLRDKINQVKERGLFKK